VDAELRVAGSPHPRRRAEIAPVTASLSPLDLLTSPAPTRVVDARVVEASTDVAICVVDGVRVPLPVTAFYPNRVWEVGACYLLAASDGAPPAVSATADELIALLLDGLVPEVRDGRVRVMRVARHVGVRSKVAVAATEPGLDPIGAVLGRGANRVKALSALLLGERVDVVSYHQDPERFLLNALAVAPLKVERESAPTEGGTPAETTVVTVPRHQLEAARGGGNLNVVLASRLCSRRIRVVAG